MELKYNKELNKIVCSKTACPIPRVKYMHPVRTSGTQLFDICLIYKNKNKTLLKEYYTLCICIEWKSIFHVTSYVFY